MKKVCLDCKPGKNCMVHHKYDTGDYVVLPPDRRAKRIVELEQENTNLRMKVRCWEQASDIQEEEHKRDIANALTDA